MASNFVVWSIIACNFAISSYVSLTLIALALGKLAQCKYEKLLCGIAYFFRNLAIFSGVVQSGFNVAKTFFDYQPSEIPMALLWRQWLPATIFGLLVGVLLTLKELNLKVDEDSSYLKRKMVNTTNTVTGWLGITDDNIKLIPLSTGTANLIYKMIATLYKNWNRQSGWLLFTYLSCVTTAMAAPWMVYVGCLLVNYYLSRPKRSSSINEEMPLLDEEQPEEDKGHESPNSLVVGYQK